MSIVSKEEYWTTILNDYSQFGQITTEDSEFNSIANDVWNVLENSFIKIDDEESVIKWEEMIGLSGEGLTIFQRKVNILYTLTVKNYLPIGLFTQAMDRLVGGDNYAICFNEYTQRYEVECRENYETGSFLYKRLANEQIDFMRTILPLDYLQLEFLESPGSLRIDTLCNATDRTCVEIEYADTNISNWTPLVCTLSGSKGFSVLATGTTSAGNGPRFDYGSSLLSLPGMDVRRGRHIIRKEGTRNFIDGTEVRANDSMPTSTWGQLCLLHFPAMYAFTQCKLYSYKKWEQGEPVLQHFIPALDPTGIPCMFDLISKTAFRNVGEGLFIAGLTLQLASRLGSKLTNTGGTLTVSLPEGYDMNDNVNKSLLQAEDKGWILTIQTYAADSTTSTFDLRRIWVRKVQDDYGSYVTSDGIRWRVEWCVDIIGAEPESLGYEQFRSIEAATDYWGLMTFVDPIQEETLNNFTKND